MMLNPFKRRLLSRSEKYTYRGVPMQKNPADLAVYSMLLWNLRPKTIIEIGSYAGGSAMWFADQTISFDFPSFVYSIDLAPPSLNHDRVAFLYGDAKDLVTAFRIRDDEHPWLIIEDSAHDYHTTMAVLEFFNQQVTKGDCVIVEDVHVPQVDRAVRDWLVAHKRYQTDHHYQDFWGFSDHAYMRVA